MKERKEDKKKERKKFQTPWHTTLSNLKITIVTKIILFNSNTIHDIFEQSLKTSGKQRTY